MKGSTTQLRIPKFWGYWILATTVGWSMRILELWLKREEGTLGTVRTLAEIPEVLLVTSISGLLAGLIMGLGQWRDLRSFRLTDENKWLWSTFIGMALLAPLGISISTAMAWISWPGDFLPENRTMFLILYPTHYIYGGFMLGAFQWLGLRNMLEKRGWKVAALWIFGTWAGIGLGVFSGPFVSYSIFHMPSQMGSRFITEQAITGLILGIVTGAILLILLCESRNNKT